MHRSGNSRAVGINSSMSGGNMGMDRCGTDRCNMGNMVLNSNSVAHLSGDLLMDRVTDLTGNIGTLLDGSLDRDLVSMCCAFLNSFVNTLGLRHLTVDGLALLDGFVNTLCLRNLDVDGSTFIDGLVDTLGFGNLLVDGVAFSDRFVDAVGLRNLLVDGGALLPRHSSAHRHGNASGDSDAARNLDGNLSALSLGGGLASGSNGSRGSGNNSRDTGSRYKASRH